jgi:hypothetical protein
MNSCIVTPKQDKKGNRYIGIEAVDPYNIFLDPTGRKLYRIRRIEMDMNELKGLAELTDSKGKFLYNKDKIEQTTAAVVALMRAEREKRTGTGQWLTSNRTPVVLHEYLGTLIDGTGKVVGENVLCVVANNQFLIRGPEPNPFWHECDWLITAPVITVPLSPYGRGYVENFASIVKTYNELTNMLLDGVFTSALKAFAAVPSMLEDPSQIDEGVYPNVVFRLAEGMMAGDFMKEVNLGALPQDAFQIWAALKKEMQEGAAFNELSLGQLAPRGRTSATEIGTVEQNSTSLIRGIAHNIEVLFLEPLLDVLWKSALQHLDPKDDEIKAAIGPDWFKVIYAKRKQFAKHRTVFTVRGISSMIMRQQKLQTLMQFLQVIGTNPVLTQVFLQEIDPGKLFDYLLELFDIEQGKLELSPREQMMKQLTGQGGQPQPGQPGQPGQPPPGGPAQQGQQPQRQLPPPARPNPAQPAMNAGGGQRIPPQRSVPMAAARQTTANAGGA